MLKLYANFFSPICILLFVFQISIINVNAQCDINSCADAPVLTTDDPVFDVATGSIIINNVSFGKFGCSEPTFKSGASIYIYQLLPNGDRISSCTVVNSPPNNFIVNVPIQFGQESVCDLPVFNFGTIPATVENGFGACDGAVYEIEIVMYITELSFDEQLTVYDQLPTSQYIVRNLGTVAVNFTDEFPTNADPLTTASIKRFPSGETGTVQLACGETLELEIEALSRLSNCSEFSDITTGVPSELSNEFYYSVDGAERIVLQDASTGAFGGQLTGQSSGSNYCYAGLLGVRAIEFNELSNIVDGSNVVFTVTTTDVFTQQTVQDQITIIYTGEGCPPPQETMGCTDPTACNYNATATIDNGSCQFNDCLNVCGGYTVQGSACDDGDPLTINDTYDADCNCGGNQVPGCTDAAACNYNADATIDDGSCLANDCLGDCGGTATAGATCDDGDATTTNDVYDADCNCVGNQAPGCTDAAACNYDVNATVDDGSCLANDCIGVCGGAATAGTNCDDGDATTTNDVYDADCNCVGNQMPGCTDAAACNYDVNATVDDGSCLANDCLGDCGGAATAGTTCDDGDASSINDVYDADCNCVGIQLPGCTDATACNYDANATIDDESCRFESYYFNCNCAGPCPAGFNQDDECNCISQCPTAPDAGQDADLSVCANDEPINLFDVLGGTPEGGGEWYYQSKGDPLDAISDFIFTPGLNLDGQYLYFHFQGDECAFSSAVVTVTTNEVYQIDSDASICEGESYTLPNGEVATESGVYQSNLTTVQNCDSIIVVALNVAPLDCEGVCGGTTNFGAACTDTNGNAGTYTGACECVANSIFGCTDSNACNYSASATENDDSCTYPESEFVDCDGNCAVEIDCNDDCGGTATAGTACDDGDPDTENDVYNADCNCAGTITPPQCNAVAGTLSIIPSGNFNDGSYVCFGNEVQTEPSNLILGTDQYQYFIFHTDNINADGSFPIESIIQYGNTLSNNLGQLTIYSTAVIAVDDGTGQPNFNDLCTVYSNTLTINFLNEIAVTSIDDNCNTQLGEYSFTIEVTGGFPASAAGENYSATGNVYTGDINFGQNLPIGPITDTGSYTINITDENGCIATVNEQFDCTKLPISLIDFSGEVQENGDLLKWTSASEINNNYYTLQHSTDGENFNTISTIDGAGTTSTVSQYQFFNRTIVNGNNYYQLLQTDFDNTTANLGVIQLIRSESQANTLNIYPVPTIDILYVEIDDNFNNAVNIYNATGQKINVEKYSITSTKNVLAINIEKFAAGVYMVNILDGDKIKAAKFIKE